LVNLYFVKCCEDPKKTRLSLAFKVCLFVANSKTFLEDFLSFIYHKEGDCHDDINDEENHYSRDPRLEYVKAVTKEGWADGCQNVASGLGKSRQLGCLFRGASFDGEANHEIREKSATGSTNQEMRY